MERLLSTPEAKAERNRLQILNKERLQKRLNEGDTTLRKTVFGNIKQKRTRGAVIQSAEGIRFFHSSTTLPKVIGETAIYGKEIIPAQQKADENAVSTEIAPQVDQEILPKFEQD